MKDCGAPISFQLGAANFPLVPIQNFLVGGPNALAIPLLQILPVLGQLRRAHLICIWSLDANRLTEFGERLRWSCTHRQSTHPSPRAVAFDSHDRPLFRQTNEFRKGLVK